MRARRKKTVLIGGALALLLSAAAWGLWGGDGPEAAYRTAAVERGDLVLSIRATGTVVPEEVIDVGAQVAGQIFLFGQDAEGKTVDYGSAVEAGTVLARIDDSLYAADAAQTGARIQAARAGLQRAEADLEQARAKRVQAERDWNRARKLGPSEALAQASYDAYQSGFETSRASVAVAEASILQARAELLQAEAADRRARRNLGYCTITSPVKGIVIDRRVNIGQTVVASLNAPSLFLIAKDLTRMQVWVPVNEADIGRIHPGQRATFTVDAYPGESFDGQVGKIRLNASMTQNVVTYTVEVVTDNASGRLLPYLTANVQFELDHLRDVLLVPATALRWSPPGDPAAEAAPGPGQAPGERGPAGAGGAGAGRERPETGRVWVVDGQRVRPLTVTVGPSDGTSTEVSGPDLREGLQVAVGMAAGGEPRDDAGNPFVPSFRRR